MKKTFYEYNSLLRVYNKYRRKLINLREANKNLRRQNILRKHISRLHEKLMALNVTLKLATSAASVVVGSMLFVNSADAQSFSAKQINPFSLNNAYYNSAPTFADIDGDGDLDMLSGSDDYYYDYYGCNCYEYYFKYYENIGTATNPDYDSPQINPFGITAPSIRRMTPTFVDLDNDGDMDIVYGDNDGNFHYMQNSGTSTAPIFDAPQMNPFGLSYLYYTGRSAPSFADLDNDGDLDMISGGSNGGFYYFPNNGNASSPSFGLEQGNPFGMFSVYSSTSAPAFIDIDNDGDFDVISGDNYGDFYYFENFGTIGSPVFGGYQTNPFNLTQVGSYSYVGKSKPAFADLDNDGDMDLMAGDSYGDFNFYRQCLPTTSTISPVEACSYTSPSGNYYTSGGTFIDIIPNAAGCDSTITINLTINPMSDQTVMATNATVCYGSSTTIQLGSTQNNVSYFLRDDSDDSIVDGPIVGDGSSALLNTGNLTSTTTYNVYAEKAVTSGGLEFDGNNDYVDGGSGIDLSNKSFSIEFWAKKNVLSAGDDNHIIGLGDNTSSNNALHIGFRGNNNFTFAFFGNDLDAPSSLADTDWHHWAVTYDKALTERTIYRDGIAVANGSSSNDFTGTGNLKIGRAYNGSNNNFNGVVDEVRVWSIARTQNDIQADMNTCLTGSESGLEAYYQFEDGLGSSTVSDATVNGNDGSLTNMDVNNAWDLGVAVCASCNLELTQTVTVTVSPAINTATTTSGETITADLSGAGYQWVDCDNANSPINLANNQSYTATSNGNYAVEITENGCTATSNCVTISTVSVESLDLNSQLVLYPNPTKGLFHIAVSETLIGRYLELTNTMGQVIETRVIDTEIVDFNLENLSDGIYFIEVETPNGKISKKIIKN